MAMALHPHFRRSSKGLLGLLFLVTLLALNGFG